MPPAPGLPFCARCLLEPAQGDTEDWQAFFASPEKEIGGCVIGACLGAGGFAEVYSAERLADGARVAVKLLRPGMDSREVLARFELEQRVLRHLHHPGIVRIFESGITAQGRPFFIMEQVDGLPITQYCAVASLTVRSRVALFAAVCDAVHYAHQKAVLHRDLKPGNILVEETPGGPEPKIIDFGVAKALESLASGQTLATRLGEVVGTPSYISPEQAGGTDDADTRSDIYSLGAVLYEILTGHPPWSADEIRRIPPATLRSFLSTRLPLAPSLRARTAGAPASLIRQLTRDLDHIVLRAMAPEPGRRYSSAAALAEDARHWLTGRAVMARPPSLAYHVSRFVRRYRWQSAAALALIAGVTAVSFLGFLLAARARSDARIIAAERDRAISAEKATDTAHGRAAHAGYQAAIQVARLQIASGQHFLAAQRLHETDPTLRGWEWQVLAAELPAPLMEMVTELPAATLVAASPDGVHAAVAAGAQMHLVNLQTHRTVMCCQLPGRIERMAVAHDGRHVAACTAGSGNAAAVLFTMDATGRTLWSREMPAGTDLAWEMPARGGALLSIAGSDGPGSISRMEAVTGRTLAEQSYDRGKASFPGIILGLKGHLAAVRRSTSTFDLINLDSLEVLPGFLNQPGAFAADALVDEQLQRIIFAQRAFVWTTLAPDLPADAAAVLALRKTDAQDTGANQREQPVRRLNMLEDGRWVAIGDTLIRVEGEPARQLPNPGGLVSISLAGGRRMTLHRGGRLEVFPEIPPPMKRELTCRHIETDNGGRRIAISPDSGSIVMQTRVRAGVCFVDAATPQKVVRYRTPARGQTAWSLLPVFHPDGTLICAGKEYLEAMHFDGKEVRSVPLPLPPDAWSAAASGDGAEIAVGTAQGLIVLDWAHHSIQRSLTLQGGPFRVFAGPGRGLFYALGKDGRFHCCGSAAAAPVQLPVMPSDKVTPVTAWHDGLQLLAVEEPGGAHIYSVTGEGALNALARIATPTRVTALAFDSGGTRLAVAAEGHPIAIWDWRHSLPLLELPVRNGCTSMAFSADGRFFVHSDTSPSAAIYGLK